MNPDPGGLTVEVGDRTTQVSMTGGASWEMPIGVRSLVEGPLEHADRPAPEQLTNALGLVEDHFDDIVRDAPMVESAPSIAFRGIHAFELACVEIGDRSVPGEYVAERADLDEVFRTVVAETIDERLHNPGLDPAHVETLIGTCCIVLALVRRLDLQRAAITPTGT